MITHSWDRPPLTTKGSKTKDQIHLERGKALDRWEVVEGNLAYLFAILLNTSWVSCSEMFGAIISSAGRYDLVKAAARAYFFVYPDKRKQILADINKLQKHTGLRNDLAHGTTAYDKNLGHVLIPAAYATQKFDGNTFDGEPAFRYSHTDIKEIGGRFLALNKKIEGIIEDIDEWTKTVPQETIPPIANRDVVLGIRGTIESSESSPR